MLLVLLLHLELQLPSLVHFLRLLGVVGCVSSLDRGELLPGGFEGRLGSLTLELALLLLSRDLLGPRGLLSLEVVDLLVLFENLLLGFVDLELEPLDPRLRLDRLVDVNLNLLAVLDELLDLLERLLALALLLLQRLELILSLVEKPLLLGDLGGGGALRLGTLRLELVLRG